VIRIAITAAAFDAITGTLPLGSVGFERDLTGARSGGPAFYRSGDFSTSLRRSSASSSSSFKSAMYSLSA
jgi:hypothetical protein